MCILFSDFNFQLEEDNFSFFPIDRALSLEHETDEKEERINYLERQVAYLVNRIKEEVSYLNTIDLSSIHMHPVLQTSTVYW